MHAMLLRTIALAAVMLSSSAVATVSLFTAALDGGQVVPAVVTPGTGAATLVLDDIALTITVDASWDSLLNTATAGHIHTGAAGSNGPITFTFAGVPATATGSIPQQVFPITPAQIADLQAGNFYVDFHDATFPGGEIRGQFVFNASFPAPPNIVKAFGATVIPLNSTTSLTFTVTNPNPADSLSGISFTDNLPGGLVLATPASLVNGCGGFATATDGAGSVSLGGVTLAGGASCVLTVNVQGTSAGMQNNDVSVTAFESGDAGTGSSATLGVAAPPTISKAFGATTIPVNGTTSLTFILTNPTADVSLTGVAFTDTLPLGMLVATPAGLNNTCGGTPSAIAGTGSVSLTGVTLAGGASCTIAVNITSTTATVQTNSVTVTSPAGGTGNTSNAALAVFVPPTIAKFFGVAAIALNGSTTLAFSIANNDLNVTLNGVGFTDTLPAGLVVSTPNGLTGNCGGGTITATAGAGAVSLAGATLAPNTTCNFSVNVIGSTAGVKSNSVTMTSTQGGTGNTSIAAITVVSPPTITKAFGAASIPVGVTTALSFTLTNGNATVALSGVAFTDTLPAGMVVSTPNGLTGSCGGGTITATAGAGTVTLAGATLAAGASCTFGVNVTGTASGVKNNSVTATSTQGGSGAAGTASLTVGSPPGIVKVFGAAAIPLNGSTSLSFTVTNTDAILTLTGIGFTDTLPTGLLVSTPNGLTGTCGGGTITATAGAGSVTLAGASLAPSASCTFSVNVTGSTAGVKINSVTANSTQGGASNTSNATLAVLAPPAIAKVFGAATLALNGATSLTFTLTNSNTTVSLAGVAFSDTLPAGLVVSTPNGLSGTCGGGTITAPAGGSAITLAGATLAASAACTFSVNVTGITPGNQNNVTGSVSSTNGGPGTTASATITVTAPPVIDIAFAPSAITTGASSTLTFTITNPAANAIALAGVAVTDVLPDGLSVAAGSTVACNGTVTTTSPGTIALTGATIAPAGQCQFSVIVFDVPIGVFTNTTGNVTSSNAGTGNAALATLTVTARALIPTLSGGALALLAGLLLLGTLRTMRKRDR